ncbi:unnamed protein product [marine sediment metagenome]|uniref:ParB/Sulfiredoxin domain-containing protein n=1 Tax=marine sediment metagenome TaxID=412755 RepID=X1EKQ2_9ZZZZ
MAVSEALIIAAPAAVGVSLAAPEEYSPALSVLLSSLGVGCGIIGLNLTREGQLEPDPDRLENVRELMELGVCLEPVDVVCSRTLDKCRIKDGRHRIVAAKEMGREKLLTLREYVK